jgi:hypothetical protein
MLSMMRAGEGRFAPFELRLSSLEAARQLAPRNRVEYAVAAAAGTADPEI